LSAAAFTHQRNLKFSLFSSAHRLGACSPLTVIEHARIECNALTRQLRYLGFQLTQKHRNHLQSLANQLTTLSPRETVARGYAIVRDPVTGTVVTDVSQLHQGARVRAEISRGWFEATVSQLEPASTPESSTE
jgi:exonuclease VII large subunit